MKQCAIVFFVSTFGALVGLGGPISFSQCPAVGTNTTGCELLITVTAVNGSGAATAFSVATSSPDFGPFDGSEDTLIGIQNSAGAILKSIALSGGVGSGVFLFDFDGACTGTYTPGPTAAMCPGGAFTSTDPGDYGSVNASVVAANGDSGTVFVGGGSGLANGGSAWFDLEGQISGSQITPGVPEPGSIGLLGTGLLTLVGFARRRRTAK